MGARKIKKKAKELYDYCSFNSGEGDTLRFFQEEGVESQGDQLAIMEANLLIHGQKAAVAEAEAA